MQATALVRSAPVHTVGRRAVGALNDTPVEFKVELKEPEPKPFPSVPETKNIYV